MMPPVKYAVIIGVGIGGILGLLVANHLVQGEIERVGKVVCGNMLNDNYTEYDGKAMTPDRIKELQPTCHSLGYDTKIPSGVLGF